MAITTAKSVSVTVGGLPDGWVPSAGWAAEVDPRGSTRLVISVPTDGLAAVHAGLVRALEAPLGFLYRQVVDRRAPRPQGAPPVDFVRDADTVTGALAACADLVYHDARCEVWVRGRLGEQVVLDADGLLYCYPDDPVFRDVLDRHELPPDLEQTILDRDYARHSFHAEADALEPELRRLLGLVEAPPGFR